MLNRVSRAGSTVVPRNKSSSSPVSVETEMESLFPEGVLGLLKETCHGEVNPWVKRICTNLGKKQRLKRNIAIALQNIIKTSEFTWLSRSMPIEKWTAPQGAWFLLSEVSAFLCEAVDWEFLHHHWQLLDKCNVGESTGTHVEVGGDEAMEGIECKSVAWAGDRVFLLQTISNVSVELPPEPAADLAHNLLKRLEEFNMNLTEVSMCGRKYNLEYCLGCISLLQQFFCLFHLDLSLFFFRHVGLTLLNSIVH